MKEVGKSDPTALKNTYEQCFLEIPEIFFEEILDDYPLSRNEIRVLLFLYRQVWCYPNLYSKYGISNLNNLLEMSKNFNLRYNDLHKVLKRLEEYEFIQTIRSGQYFVRRFFLPEYDELFNQEYDDFDF
jgi:DNA-binding MarR family transcriptional regulator